MIDVNHYLLCSLNVGHEKIEKIRQITQKFGFHSKITGAGGGGCMLTFVPKGNEIYIYIYIYLYILFKNKIK